MPSKIGHRSAIAAAALSSLLASSSADAFCRATTTSHFDGENGGTNACSSDGKPLFHPSQCLPYHLLAEEPLHVSNGALSDTVARAFSAWSAPNPTCTPGITAIELPPSAATQIVSFTMGGPNENLVGFTTPWHHGEAVLALPTLTFNATTGAVLDVDLEISDDVAWSVRDPVPSDGYDLQSVLAHEAGHVFGLADSYVVGEDGEAPTMFGRYDSGDTSQRTLEVDDQQAICTVYPSRSERLTADGLVSSTTCNLSPGTGGCGGDADITHGCSASASTTRSGPAGIALLIALGAIAARARKRSATSHL